MCLFNRRRSTDEFSFDIICTVEELLRVIQIRNPGKNQFLYISQNRKRVRLEDLPDNFLSINIFRIP